MSNPKKFALAAAASLALLASTASAHVTYLLPEKAFAQRAGSNWEYLLSGLGQTGTWAFGFFAAAVAFAAWLIYAHSPAVRAFFARVVARADSYGPFTPWMLRLSLGIALIGSGASGFLVSPILPGYEALSGAQVLLGFCLMSGFLVVPAAFGAIALYAVALGESWTIIGSFEFLAIAMALIVIDNERPGLDDMLCLPKMSPFRKLKELASVFLRVGLGLSLTSMALYEKILNPLAGDAIVRAYRLTEIVPVSPAMWVLGAGVTEFALGALLIIGWKTRPVVGLTFVVLSLSFFYFGEDVASHVTLFGALSALFVMKAGAWSVDSWLERRHPSAKPAVCESR